MSHKVRFGQVGVGIAHARAFRETLQLMPEAEIVAFSDPDPADTRSSIPPELQGVPIFADPARMYAEVPMDAVIISLPADVTPAAIIQAAKAGVNVLAEKPCARTAAEFLPAAEAIEKAGVSFSTGYLRRFYPVALAIKNLVDQGLLGRLVSVEARWITSSVKRRDPRRFFFSRARSGGGMLHWLGCHMLDLMRFTASAEVTEVAGIEDTLSGEAIDVEDMAALALRYDNGMIGSLHCAYVLDRADDQLFFGLRGTLGWVNWEQDGNEFQVRSVHPAWAAAPNRVLRFDPDPLGGYGGATGIVSLRQFIASFRDGVPPAVIPDDALRILEVLDAAQESSRTGRRVAIARRVGIE